MRRALLIACCALASSLAWSAQDHSAVLAQLRLPPVPATRTVIAALPQVNAARAGVALAQARGQRLQAGAHEWVLKAGTQQRSESSGQRYTEAEFALERGIRWGGKAQTDSALAAAGVAVGEFAYADVWHEAVRALLQAWYEWQRARSAMQVLSSSSALAQEQLAVAARRVRAGDAPRMEQLMAQAEVERAQAALALARGRAQVLLQNLRQRFPGLQVAESDDPPRAEAPNLQLPGALADWRKRLIDDNHEVELMEAEVRVARLQSQRVQQEGRPDPLLGVRASRERGGLESVLGVYLAIPLAGAQRQADQGAALALLEAAEQRLLQTRQKVEANADTVLLQMSHSNAVAQRLHSVQQVMSEVAQLTAKAYALGELTLTEALQARRNALEAHLGAQAARWDTQEALARVLVDAHQLWPAEEDAHH